MRYCSDCGTILRSGICGNCHEELAILTFQYEYCDEKQYANKEFMDKANESQRIIDEMKQGIE